MIMGGSPLSGRFWSTRLAGCHVRMRDVLSARDHLKGLGQAAGIERRIVIGVGASGQRTQAFVPDPLGGSALEDALPSSLVGLVDAAQQDLQIAMAGDRDP